MIKGYTVSKASILANATLSNLIITDCVNVSTTGSQAECSTIAVSVGGYTVSITGCTIFGNTCTHYAAGMIMGYGIVNVTNSLLLAEREISNANRAGSIYTLGVVKISGSTIDRVSYYTGGKIILSGKNIIKDRVAVLAYVDNSVTSVAGRIYLVAGSTIYINDSPKNTPIHATTVGVIASENSETISGSATVITKSGTITVSGVGTSIRNDGTTDLV